MNHFDPTPHLAAARVLRIASVSLTLALIALIATWHLWPTPTLSNVLLALVLCIPLIAPLVGLVKGRRYTYKWSTLCVLPYLIIGCTEVIANPQRRAWSAVMLLLGLCLFASLLGFLRTRCDFDPNVITVEQSET